MEVKMKEAADCLSADIDLNNNSSEKVVPCPEVGGTGTVESDKYNLRRSSRKTRVQTEEKRQQQLPRQRKAKSRPPPLSKYRRRSANARERFRMAEINDAFEELKQVLPQDRLQMADEEAAASPLTFSPAISGSSLTFNPALFNTASSTVTPSTAAPAGKSRKGSTSTTTTSSRTKNQPTKYTVLRLAINYIAALRDILGYSEDGSSISSGSGSSREQLSDDLGSDAASSCAPSTSCGSGDEESLLSPDVDAVAGGMADLDFFPSSLAADFSPDLSPDFTATLSPEEEMCLELVASVLDSS